MGVVLAGAGEGGDTTGGHVTGYWRGGGGEGRDTEEINDAGALAHGDVLRVGLRAANRPLPTRGMEWTGQALGRHHTGEGSILRGAQHHAGRMVWGHTRHTPQTPKGDTQKNQKNEKPFDSAGFDGAGCQKIFQNYGLIRYVR